MAYMWHFRICACCKMIKAGYLAYLALQAFIIPWWHEHLKSSGLFWNTEYNIVNCSSLMFHRNLELISSMILYHSLPIPHPSIWIPLFYLVLLWNQLFFFWRPTAHFSLLLDPVAKTLNSSQNCGSCRKALSRRKPQLAEFWIPHSV